MRRRYSGRFLAVAGCDFTEEISFLADSHAPRNVPQ
jgi:hypothetical protein